MSIIESVYKHAVRPQLFRMGGGRDAEVAHEWTVDQMYRMQDRPLQLSVVRRFCTYDHPMLRTQVFGVHFPNPFGLAPGFDKYCRVYHTAVPAFGWGFCEIGGITRDKQEGNPRTVDDPRMRRSPDRQSVWNWMGFNNPGVADAQRTVLYNPIPRIPTGLNVGKSKHTPLEVAYGDYRDTLQALLPFFAFAVLNPSSPNTPGIRNLQNADMLCKLISMAKGISAQIAKELKRTPWPIGVKLSPDESDEQYADMISACRSARVDFIVLTNTSVGRHGCEDWVIPSDRGGISGARLRELARRRLIECRKVLKGSIPLIGVGGICDADTLYDRILCGGDICEALTAWPFEGPDFAKRCLRGVVERLRADGFTHVRDAVGKKVD